MFIHYLKNALKQEPAATGNISLRASNVPRQDKHQDRRADALSYNLQNYQISAFVEEMEHEADRDANMNNTTRKKESHMQTEEEAHSEITQAR